MVYKTAKDYTFKELYEGHRKLWQWVSEDPWREKADWPEWESYGFSTTYLKNHSYCFACMIEELVADSPAGHCNSTCPLIWPDKAVLVSCGTLYSNWLLIAKYPNRCKYAEKIRDLPLRYNLDKLDSLKEVEMNAEEK